jgi:CheY-like chemotaxis protein
MLTNITRQYFTSLVHEALNHLYDSPFLEAHPLGDLLIQPDQQTGRRSQDLRRILLEAIHAMQPEADTPQHSRDCRAYRILELRYISNLPPGDVMLQLALSRSFFYEEQARIFDALVDGLWKQRLASVPRQFPSPSITLADEETNRLLEHANWEPVNLDGVLQDLKPVVQSLAESRQSTIEFDLSQPLRIWHSDRVLLRQVLLDLIIKELDAFPGGTVRVSIFSAESKAGIAIQGQSSAKPVRIDKENQAHGLNLETCQRILETMMGKLVYLKDSPRQLLLQIEWPHSEERKILVIDDNVGMGEFIARSLSGEGWQVLSAANGTEARQKLAEFQPAIILLDVILPREDGWELLMALKADEKTRDIPVVICSAIHEPQLATSLGAVSYLPKPITQPALHQVLKQWSRLGASSEIRR